jgi:hypothetical protein
MERLKGEPLQLVLLQKITHSLVKAIGTGDSQRQDLGHVPGLGKSKGLQGRSPLAHDGEGVSHPLSQDPLYASSDQVPGGGNQ